MATNIIDSFFVALGFKLDGSGLKDVKRQSDEARESLLSVGNALKAFAAGFALKKIADFGDAMEQNTNAIAGFLTALGVSKNFDAGLEDAEKTIKAIETSAAKLPGEAEEYIEVFRAGLPVLKAAMPGGSLEAMTEFTNMFTAVGKSLNIDSGQIGRGDLKLMLGPIGRAGANVRTFSEMLSFIKLLPGQANLTAESFNRMSQQQRLALLQATMANDGLRKMVDRSASSFDAMRGAALSMVKTLTRGATAPLFEGMKRGLDRIRALFMDEAGEPTKLGKQFIEMGKRISQVILQIVSAGAAFVEWLLKSEHAMKILKGVVVGLGVALGALALDKTTGGFLKMFKALTNIKTLIAGGIFGFLVLALEDLYVYLRGGKSIIGTLEKKFPEAFGKIKSALSDVADLVGTLKPLLIGLATGGLDVLKNHAVAAAVVLGAIFAPWATAITGAILLLEELKAMNKVEEPQALKDFKSTWGDPAKDEEPDFLHPGSGRRRAAARPFYQGGDMVSVPRRGASSSTSYDVTQHNNINITTPDPVGAGREVERAVTRSLQKGYTR